MTFTVGLITLIVSGYVLGALLAQLIVRLDPDQSGILLDRGPGKLMRRITMIAVLMGLPLLLKKTSWQGWRDNGMGYQGMAPVSRIREYLLGFGIGLITLHGLLFIGVLQGSRYWDPDYVGVAIVTGWLGYLFRAVFIGIGEEIVARGIFFRSVARMWRVWPTAIITSLIFALGHFLKPQDYAFGGAFGVGWIFLPIQSMFDYMGGLPLIEFRVVNMTLMSVVLCLLVYRRKTIWLAAGLHGGWILAKAMNGKFFSTYRENGIGWWAGARSDFTDSLLCTLMLLTLFIIVLFMKNRAGVSPGDESNTFYSLQ